MKYILLFLLSFSSLAETTVSASHTRINQNLFGTISFPMDALTLSGTYWYNNIGLRLSAAKSTETANNLYVEGKRYSAQITHLYSLHALYRVKLNNKWSIQFGAGKTDMRSDWTVNNIPAAWGYDSDSDYSFQAGIEYKYHDDISMRFEYIDYYRKDKEGYGREETRGFGFGFVYAF